MNSAKCTTDCVGKSCQSITDMNGVCVNGNAFSESQCIVYENSSGLMTLWYNSTICLLPTLNEAQCTNVIIFWMLCCIFLTLLQISLVWNQCADYSVSDCTMGTAAQRYLGCYVSLWRPCENQVQEIKKLIC
jgi:hypothetical protein